ncbi:hypothetical protein [Leadbetterella sp. DM7]|uniref:hypothetical protein n=1 Tax=Leadbetterella sp. DM7 TaxID=3235085 RepID=UPI00349E6C31
MEGASYEKTEAEFIKNGRIGAIQLGVLDDPYNDKRRIVGEFVRHYSVVYISLQVKMRYQKKNWIGWSNTSCYYMYFYAEGLYQKRGDVIPFYGSRSGYNEEEISMFVDELYNLDLTWRYTYGSGQFQGGSGDPSITSFYF